MAIAKLNPTVTTVKRPVPVETLKEKEIYKTVAADSAIQPPPSLIAYLEGMAWTVEYYSQLLSRDDDIREIDIGQNAALQQYRKFNGQELRVQSDLAPTYDEATGRTEVTGTAIVSNFVPNRFDYFITEAGLKGYALFMVNGSLRKTYQDTTAYEITYTLIGYLDQPNVTDKVDALKARTVSQFYFHKERLLEGLNPLLTTEDHGLSIKLKENYFSMMKQYFSLYFSPTDRLLVVPSESDYVYDPRLANFIRQVTDTVTFPEFSKVQRVSTDRDFFLSQISVLTALIERDPGLLNSCMAKVGMVSRSYFSSNSFLTAANCWKVSNYIYPDIDESTANFSSMVSKTHPSTNLDSWFIDMTALADNTWFENEDVNQCQYGDRVINVIKRVHKDNYYIFSSDFYWCAVKYDAITQGSLSLLEILVLNYLKDQPLNLQHLDYLVKKWTTWPSLEKFYYTPILSILIQEAIRGFY